MHKLELIRRLARRSGFSQAETARFLNAFLDTVVEALESGERVVLTGFGAFEVREREAREGINPRTGAPLKIPPRKTVAFKPSRGLKARLNGEG